MSAPTIEVVNVMIAINRELHVRRHQPTPQNQLLLLQESIECVSQGARTPDDFELLEAIKLAYDFTWCATNGIQF